MATVSNPNAAVVAGNGVGPTTYIFSVTTATVQAQAVKATATYGLTIAGIGPVVSSAHIVLAQGANTDGTNGWESETGGTLTGTVTQNP